ncbi:dihydrolipoamide acetyltransferase family protein [Salinibacterium sp. TMP30]|uniref:dihydrolipoamide acetyltransferase family protein n=1 Tax=Salinibacterium sp. TMP30 TaxID=3138237 RepID=UPI0031397EE8
MAINVFYLPDLGEGLTEAALVRWIVAVGDSVAIDQAIAEVETAKSIVEVPSPYAGTVSTLHGEEGEMLNVGAPLLEVDNGAAVTTEVAPSAPIEVELEAHREEEQAGSGNVLIGYGTKVRHSSGRTRRRVTSPALVPAATPLKTKPARSGPVAVRSPIVRRLARSSGIDLLTIVPTAPDGVIRREDVLKAAATSEDSASTAARLPVPAHADLEVVRREPMGMLRKAVSARLSRSRTEIPEATVWVDVDATALWELRQAMGDGRPSLTAFIAKFVLLALAEYPVLAGRLSEDGSEILEFDGVNLGIAANTPRGLMVPVLRHAERDSIADLDTAIRRLAEDAQEGRLSPAELSGSTFTLNNYGSLGVDGSAAIINHPEVAMLGVGRMIERPWVVGGAIIPRRIVQLSMVFDHRVCDGGYASGFLRSVVDAIQSPARLFAQI